MYSSVVFSSTSPAISQKDPRPHICWSQHLFFTIVYSSCKIRNDLPFRYCMIWLGDSVVGLESSMCTWSVPTLPSKIRMWFDSHPCRSNSRSLKLLHSLALDNDTSLSIQKDILYHTPYGFLSVILPFSSPHYQYTTSLALMAVLKDLPLKGGEE